MNQTSHSSREGVRACKQTYIQKLSEATSDVLNGEYCNGNKNEASVLSSDLGTPCNKDCSFYLNMWPALPKPATYAHHVTEQFSPSMDCSINKLTNCQYTTAECWQVCFCLGLFLRPVRRPWMLRCPLNATGWLVQAITLLEITTRLVDDIGHGFSNVLRQFECAGASLWSISPWKMQSLAVTCHFVTPHHPYISACGVDKNYLKWWEI